MSEEEAFEKAMGHRLFDWFGAAVIHIGIDKTKMMLQALLEHIEEKEGTESD